MEKSMVLADTETKQNIRHQIPKKPKAEDF